ncbi:MAG: hypothetical protein FJX72_06895 [Armatimonadetes bacterium]|nr:hypothetical protein [Armatimonadota bacterium]
MGLAATAAVSLATLNPVPLLIGLVAEAGYLLFVPDTPWYRRRLAERAREQESRKREELKNRILPYVGPAMQRRYARLEATRAQIAAQAADDQEWFAQVLHKLDYLIEKFLLFADKQRQFDAYIQTVMAGAGPTVARAPARAEAEARVEPGRDRRKRERASRGEAPPVVAAAEPERLSDESVQEAVAELEARYEREITELTREIEKEQDPNTTAVIEKRADVIRRRKEFVGRMGSILTNLNHQLGLVEDTFGLISDEIRARSPEQILADIEDVVYQTNSMTQVLDELATYEQMAARLTA